MISDEIRLWDPEPYSVTREIRHETSRLFAALLNTEAPGDHLPPLWHWFEFTEFVPTSDLGVDGHPRNGRLVPPLKDRRRVWGGCRFTSRHGFRVGDSITRTSEVAQVSVKQGRSGELLLVTERHRYLRGGEVVAEDEFDIVYRKGASDSAVGPADVARDTLQPTIGYTEGQIVFQPDPMFLFRFSALTMNAHRIHYDEAYARDVEGHPAQIVHGPLIALLVMEWCRRNWSVTVAGGAVRMIGSSSIGDVITISGTGDGGDMMIEVAERNRGQLARARVSSG